MIKRTTVAAALLSASLLAGCSSDDPVAAPGPSPNTPSSAEGPTTTPSSAPDEAAPPFQANTLAHTEDTSGGPLGVKSARAAAHVGYDRVVLELGGKVTGQPGWRVEYVPKPTSDGAGDPVAVKGSAYLRVLVTGVGYPDDTGVPEPSPKRFTPSGTTLVREVVLDGAFEGQYTTFIGLSAKKPFRVFRQRNPARVVIDVRQA